MNIRCRLGLHAPPTFEAVPHDDGAMLYERCPRCDRVLDVKGPQSAASAQRHAMLRNAGLNNADATDVGMMAGRRLRHYGASPLQAMMDELWRFFEDDT